jgi:hypothetical protein
MVSFEKNWEKWKQYQSFFPSKRFLLFQRKAPSFSLESRAVFIVNIASTAFTLNKYYEHFQRAVGDDFDPFEITFQIQNDDSKFWNIVLSRHDLLGILLGYGEQNSWLYAQCRKYEDQRQLDGTKKEMRDFFDSFLKQTPGSNSLAEFDVQLPLPAFGCYSENESRELVAKYERQRKKIKESLKGEDVLTFILERFTSEDLSLDPDSSYREKLQKELCIPSQ